MATIGNLSVTISANATAFNNAVNNVILKVGDLRNKVESDVGGGAAGAGLAGVLAGATAAATQLAAQLGGRVLGALRQVVEQSLQLAAGFEQAQIALEVMTGSAATAKKLVGDLAQFAIETPFKFEDLLKGTRLIKAMGVQTEELLPTLKMLGNAAAALGVPINQLALAYGQVHAKGKLMGPELRQFTEAGVPMVEELSKVMFGVANRTKEVYEAIENGNVGFYDMALAFENMSKKGGVFHDMMVRQNRTLLGSWNTLKETFQLTLAALGKGLAEGLGLKEGMRSAAGMAQGLKDHVKDLGPALEAVGKVGGLALRVVAAAFGVAWKEGRRLMGMASESAPNWKDLKSAVVNFAEAAGAALIKLYDVLRTLLGMQLKLAVAFSKTIGLAGRVVGAVAHPVRTGRELLGFDKPKPKMFDQFEDMASSLASDLMSHGPGEMLKDWKNAMNAIRNDKDIARPLARTDAEVLRAGRKAMSDAENAFARMGGGKLGKEALDRIRKAAEDAAKGVGGLVDKTGEIGAAAKRAAEHAAEAFRQMKEEAKKVNEEFGDPIAAFGDKLLNLQRMVEAGLVNLTVYESAAARAFDELDRKFPKTEHERPAALLAGQKETYTQIAKLREAQRDADPEKRVEKRLSEIRDELKRIRDYNAALVRGLAGLPGEILHLP